MWTREYCLSRAAEAEEMAKIVALATDKERFRQSAAEWRERAAQAGPSARGRTPPKPT